METLESQYRKITIIFVAIILAGGAYWMLKNLHPALFLGQPNLAVEKEVTSHTPTSATPVTKPEIIVHVMGAVKSPGVYRLSANARVHEAIEKAGGKTDQADIHSLNLAAKIRDGEQIYVPKIRQIPDVEQTIPIDPVSAPRPQPSARQTTSLEGSRLNINTATLQELQAIRGIGPVMAQRIIEYRKTSGRFSAVDELTNVKGIGAKTLEKIRDSITVH